MSYRAPRRQMVLRRTANGCAAILNFHCGGCTLTSCGDRRCFPKLTHVQESKSGPSCLIFEIPALRLLLSPCLSEAVPS